MTRWAAEVRTARPEVTRVGYIGSYARGDWGVGSDVDLLVIVSSSARPFIERAQDWDTIGLPVPADLLVYTEDEWKRLGNRDARFFRVATEEGVWVHP